MLNYKITDTNAFSKRITNYTYIENMSEFQQSLDGMIEERKVLASPYCQINSCDTIICISIPIEANIEKVVSTYIENDFKVLREINNELFLVPFLFFVCI